MHSAALGQDLEKEAVMSFRILTDTSCNLPERLVHEYDLDMMPLDYIVDGVAHTSFTDAKQADFSSFYNSLRLGTVVTTSMVKKGDAVAHCRRLLEAGEDILYLGFSSGISGTYQMVAETLEELKPQYPERKVFSVDTLAASAGQGLLITYVARLRACGASIEECYRWAMENRLHICHWFTVDDLMFLKRGGRISTVAAIFGTALAIRPIMHVDDAGTLKVSTKVHGRHKSLVALANKFAQANPLPEGVDRIVYISHGDCYDDAKSLADMIMEGYRDAAHPMDYPLITYVDPVIGAHSGPGTIALFYFDTAKR